MKTLSNEKRIMITGASRGIGREAALLLAARGHALVLVARNEAELARVAAEVEHAGGRAQVLPMDITDAASVTAGLARVQGPVDVLVNNAGDCEQGEFVLQDEAKQRREMELNYWGPLRLTRALLPSFIARRAGLIVNVSSLIGSITSPTTSTYGATKAALEAWSLSLRAEVARYGVNVSIFVAPHTRTSLGERVRFEGVYSLPVRYTAEGLVHAIDRAPRKFAASPVYRLLLWLGRMFPAFMEKRVGASARHALQTEAGLTAALASR
jgi:short-subunit dehydrogenase